MRRLTSTEKSFLAAYNLDPKAYSASGLTWPGLQEIRTHHSNQVPSLTSTARYIVERLSDVAGVHSLKMRVKDPDHLVAKIIRKTIQRPRSKITLRTYTKNITDLIGIRALHLFKEDWQGIHNTIVEAWELDAKPIAYVRKGDSEELGQLFRVNECAVREHPYGYRSVHYLVRSNMEKTPVVVEIQVRTLFEEGWSEIDHQIRYPQDIANPIFAQFLVIFNRLAGSADEIGSFIRFLKGHLTIREAQTVQERADYLAQIANMKAEIAELSIARKEKLDLEKRLAAISQAGTRSMTIATGKGLPGSSISGNTVITSDATLRKLGSLNLGLPSEAVRLGLVNLQSALSAVSTMNPANLSYTPPPGLLASALSVSSTSSVKPKAD